MEQCEARGGLKMLQVTQNLRWTVCILIVTSFVRGGGRYAVPLPTTVWTSTWDQFRD
jgi:hypothetical protein